MKSLRTQYCTSDPDERRPSLDRPPFDSRITSDRLEEGSKFVAFPTSGKIRMGRKSVFREIGLEDDWDSRPGCERKQPGETARRSSEPTPQTYERGGSTEGESAQGKPRWLSKLMPGRRPMIKSAASPPPSSITGIRRFTLTALLIAVVIPALGYTKGRRKIDVSGADAGVVRELIVRTILQDRADSPTDVCKRWAGQSAVLNGTLYYYGGRVKTSADQTDNTWSDDFITVDLTRSWDTNSPAISGMSQPDGPPAVSLGYLWNDYDALYLYGGQFELSTDPLPVSTWKYDISSSSWTELKDPRTSAGQYSDAGDTPVQRAAEGAGVSVPELGLSWYFGGHLDWATTPGWSNQIPRVYLKSLLEFTHPGYSNVQVDALHDSGAPDDGAYRNITWAGEQNQDGFTERADGVLVYVPGWGPGGVLLGLGGGVVGDHETTDASSSMTTIDVYDIASSRWYHQATSGAEKPRVRVNPCAAVFSAPDASSFNVYMYGGQNLLPVGEQEQYADVWILTVPSFTWVKVGAPSGGGGGPPARAGHACAARDGQLVVVGGYVGEEIQCERPGIHVFDASDLVWQSSFRAADRPPGADAGNSVLAGSHGYLVPGIVQSVIGGSSEGGATATQPASGPATDGPFKTGVPPVYTVTATGSGPTATITDPGGINPGGGNSDNDGGGARRGGTVAAGVVAGLAGLLALYLGFCAWLWRRQVRAYRKHMAIANDYGGGHGVGDGSMAAAWAAIGGEKLCPKKSSAGNARGGGSSGANTTDNEEEHFAWVGQLQPGFVAGSDEPSPGSGTGGSSGRTGWPRPSEDRSPWRFSYDSYAGASGDNGGGGDGGGNVDRSKSNATRSTRSGGSADALLDGREPNFFSVVLGPRRALRVVNGMEE